MGGRIYDSYQRSEGFNPTMNLIEGTMERILDYLFPIKALKQTWTYWKSKKWNTSQKRNGK